MDDVNSIYSQVDKNGEGLFVQASTLGSLEALLSHLRDKNIKVSQVGIGPVHRKDVIAISHMVEKDIRYAVILAFDVPITEEAAHAAEEMKVKIYPANIIYHLTDAYEAYIKEIEAQRKDKARQKVVFPVKLTMIPNAIFNRSKPIIMGVHVQTGTLRKGTPLIVITDNKPLYLGTVESIQNEKKDQDTAGPNSEVSISIKSDKDSSIVAGKDFKPGDVIISRLNREIINILKEYFRDDLKKDEWLLVVDIKKYLGIQ